MAKKKKWNKKATTKQSANGKSASQVEQQKKEKSTQSRNILWIGVFVVVLVLAAFGLWKLSERQKQPSDVLVFSVGEEKVYLDEVNLCILQNVINLGMTEDDLKNVTAEDGTNATDYYKQSILELIMNYKVECMVAKQQGIALTQEEEKEIRADVTTFMGEVDGRLLNQWGIDKDLVEEVSKQHYLAQKLKNTVTKDVEIEEQKYSTLYIMLFPIIEMNEDGSYVTMEDGETPVMLSDAEIAQRKEDAYNALKELQDGADVNEVAKKYGVESYSGEERNLTDSFGEPFAQYAKSLSEGECSPVIEIESCYGIVKMVKENDEALSEQVMSYYRADAEKEALEEARTKWYADMGIGQIPEFYGTIWEKLSLYEYVQ